MSPASVVLILFLGAITPGDDRSITSSSHPTFAACEAAGRVEQARHRGRGVFWACVLRAPR